MHCLSEKSSVPSVFPPFGPTAEGYKPAPPPPQDDSPKMAVVLYYYFNLLLFSSSL